MANEIKIAFDDSFVLYATIRNATGQVWYPTGEVFEAWGTGSRTAADYDIALAGDGGCYMGNFDSNIPAGRYIVVIYEQVGASAADNDPVVGSGEIVWDGTNEVFPYEIDGGLTAAAIADVLAQAAASVVSVEAKVDVVQAKTDGFNFTGDDVKATLDGEEVVTDSASRTASKADVSAILADTNEIQALATTGGTGSLKFIKDVLEGDISIDKTTTPWQAVVKIKGTSTELIRKNLKDADGNNITDTNALIGRYTEPS
jgi:hypothetical protein